MTLRITPETTVLTLRKTSKHFATYSLGSTTVSHNQEARLEYLDLLEEQGLKVVSASHDILMSLKVDVQWNYEGSRYSNADQLPEYLGIPVLDEA